jgi:hypothetical protein
MSDNLELTVRLGLAAIRSFKRLSYTPWHALAEFIDNSTQSYFNHRQTLDQVYATTGDRLTVAIDYRSEPEPELSITDNAMGMSLDELSRALVIGEPPANTSGRSRYGLGLKTAASWFGDLWRVDTKRLGEVQGYGVTIDVDAVASGIGAVDVSAPPLSPNVHYTRITVSHLNRTLHSKTRSTIREYLRSMYRADLRSGALKLVWMGEELAWQDESEYARDTSGKLLRDDFSVVVDGKNVQGWAGVLARGSRARAGFSIFHAGRVVKGWPDSWRPQEIYGQVQGSNNLVNQRLVGEVYLDDFEVSHTKDNVLWLGDEERVVGSALKEQLGHLIRAAETRRLPGPPSPGRNDVRVARTSVQRVLVSKEFRERWARVVVDDEERLATRRRAILAIGYSQAPDFSTVVNGLTVAGYLAGSLSSDDAYMIAGDTDAGRLVVVVNLSHPYVRGMKGGALVGHVEHCAFDALAAWRAAHDGTPSNDQLTAVFKDALLRVAANTKK